MSRRDEDESAVPTVTIPAFISRYVKAGEEIPASIVEHGFTYDLTGTHHGFRHGSTFTHYEPRGMVGVKPKRERGERGGRRRKRGGRGRGGRR